MGLVVCAVSTLTIFVLLLAQSIAHDQSLSQLLQDDSTPYASEIVHEYTTPQTTLQNDEVNEPKLWALEITYATIIILYALNYINGRNTNQKIANAWATSMQPIFTSNFSRFGDQDTFSITKESQHSYTVSCTGRIHCHGAQASLELKKRQDLVSVLMSYALSPKSDLMVYDVAMEDSAAPFIFAIVNKKEKQITKEYPDVVKFAAPVNFPALSNYIIYTDTPEIVASLLTVEITQTLKNYDQYVKFVYFSDQSTITPKYSKMLRFVFKLPSSTHDMGKLTTLIRMSFFYIDIIVNIRLSKMAAAKNEKARAKVVEQSSKQMQQERQEMIQKKKLEHKRREEEKYEKLSPEAQKKWDEREYKKQLKEKQSKFKVISPSQYLLFTLTLPKFPLQVKYG